MNHQMEQGSHYYGKRSAEADADAFYQPYGYSNYGSNWNNWYNNWNNNNMYGYNMLNNQWPMMSGYRGNFMNHQMEQGSHYYGKRSAEADADAFYQPYGYSNYGSNYGSNWNNWYNNSNNNNMYGYN